MHLVAFAYAYAPFIHTARSLPNPTSLLPCTFCQSSIACSKRPFHHYKPLTPVCHTFCIPPSPLFMADTIIQPRSAMLFSLFRRPPCSFRCGTIFFSRTFPRCTAIITFVKAVARQSFFTSVKLLLLTAYSLLRYIFIVSSIVG